MRLLALCLAMGCALNRPPAPREPGDLGAYAREALQHSWAAYETYAWGHDELRPLSKAPRDWYSGSLWITPVDALDSLILLGLDREADEARKAIDERLSFDQDVSVKNFEIVIRVLGGLLSSYQLTNDPRLLALADDLGRRLLPVFDSPTGMPYVNVNLRTGKASGARSNPAEIGTLLLEFGTLARLTGKRVYYDKPKRALTELFSRRSSIGLVADEIDVETGKWLSRESHIGGGIDSYYEYLLKAWLLFGDEDCKRMWDESAKAVARYVADGDWYGVVDFETGARLRPEYGALEAFFAGTLVLAGDLERAKKVADANFRMWTAARAEADGFDYAKMQPTHPRWPLRPEIVESISYLSSATGDPRWAAQARRIAADVDACCRVDAGYTILKDVTTGERGDLMPSYFLAETLKYFWLVDHPLPGVVLSTEAHPLRRVSASPTRSACSTPRAESCR